MINRSEDLPVNRQARLLALPGSTVYYLAKPTSAADLFQTEDGRAAYRRRTWIAEPPNGWIKHALGFRQCSLRGLDKVRTEWKLVCMALNLRRMGTLSAA